MQWNQLDGSQRKCYSPGHLKGRALSCPKFIHTLSGRLCGTKDINLQDRLGQEGQLGWAQVPAAYSSLARQALRPSLRWHGIPEPCGEARQDRFTEDNVKDREISWFALLMMWWARDGAKNWIQISPVPGGFFHQEALPHSLPWNCPFSGFPRTHTWAEFRAVCLCVLCLPRH